MRSENESARQAVAGDPIPADCQLIEVHVTELKQLFNAMDPSPFGEKDLDPRAEEFIVAWGREVHRDATLALLVYLDRPAGLPAEPTMLGDAFREFFSRRSEDSRRRLRQLLRVGRTSLLIGVVFLAVLTGVSDLIASAMQGGRSSDFLREGLLICGWVAMWRPLEIFLYDWWPIRREARLYDRLSVMPVRIAYTGDASSDAWRRDWPAVAATGKSADVRASPPARGATSRGAGPGLT